MATRATLPQLPSKTTAGWVLGAVLAAVLALAVALTHLAGEVLESVSDRNGVAAFDRPVLDWCRSIRTPTLDAAIAWYSNTGGPLWQPIVTTAIVAYLCWRWRDLTPLVLTVLAVGGSLAITVWGKRAIGRVRPPMTEAIPPFETSASFPSGHSLNAIVIAGILCYLILRHTKRYGWGVRIAWILFFTLYAVTMGLSRVYLGHHWLTDVLAGWLLGLAWLAVIIAAHRVWRGVRRRDEAGPIEEDRAPAALEGAP